jgi:hypothetical protein
MRASDDTTRLLDLLREAGDEAVSLAELEVVGVRDPASALLDLELSGHAISRILDDRTECVRLAPFDGVHLLAEPEPAAAATAEDASAPDEDDVLVAVFGEDRPASPEEEAFVVAVFGGDRPASPAGARPVPQPAAGRRMLVSAALLLLALLLASRG